MDVDGGWPLDCPCSSTMCESCSAMRASCLAMRLLAASSARMTASGPCLYSCRAWAWVSSPRTAASIRAFANFAFPGCMQACIPAQGRARKFTYFNILRFDSYALQTADMLPFFIVMSKALLEPVFIWLRVLQYLLCDAPQTRARKTKENSQWCNTKHVYTTSSDRHGNLDHVQEHT